MSELDALPDFKKKSAADQQALGETGARALLEAGANWDLSATLRDGGSIVFPHATIGTCGHQIAAAVRSCLASGARRVVALGVVHASNEDLRASRARVAAGGRAEDEPARGIQGPGVSGREDWKKEFSLDHFCFLWEIASREHRGPVPELVLRYPFLVAGRPSSLPGIGELRELAADSVVVATADPYHHGIGYGDPASRALAPGEGGLARAREMISAGLTLLESGDHPGFERHCTLARSDARDTMPVLRFLRGPLEGRILDLVADDMTGPYKASPPTWVAGALIELRRTRTEPAEG